MANCFTWTRTNRNALATNAVYHAFLSLTTTTTQKGYPPVSDMIRHIDMIQYTRYYSPKSTTEPIQTNY
jgi:hypothetical protein